MLHEVRVNMMNILSLIKCHEITDLVNFTPSSRQIGLLRSLIFSLPFIPKDILWMTSLMDLLLQNLLTLRRQSSKFLVPWELSSCMNSNLTSSLISNNKISSHLYRLHFLWSRMCKGTCWEQTGHWSPINRISTQKLWVLWCFKLVPVCTNNV